MKIKHLVIDSCTVCPFMTVEGEDHQRIFRCEAVEGHRTNRLKHVEGTVMAPPSECPLEDYDTEMSPDSLVRNHIKEKAKRWKEHKDYIKAGGSY